MKQRRDKTVMAVYQSQKSHELHVHYIAETFWEDFDRIHTNTNNANIKLMK